MKITIFSGRGGGKLLPKVAEELNLPFSQGPNKIDSAELSPSEQIEPDSLVGSQHWRRNQ